MYSYSLNTPTLGTATIKMHKEALGGKDAMHFANIIKILPNDIKILLLDMSQLELINSSGLGMLTKANNDLKTKNIKLVLSSVNKNVMHLLEITQLNKIFTIK